MRRQGVTRRQAMCRHKAWSGGNASSDNVSSQCAVIVSAKSHTQAAGALHKSIHTQIHTHVCVDHLNRCKTSIRFSLHYFFDLTLHEFTFFNFHAGGWSVLQMSPSNEDASVAQ